MKLSLNWKRRLVKKFLKRVISPLPCDYIFSSDVIFKVVLIFYGISTLFERQKERVAVNNSLYKKCGHIVVIIPANKF